MVGNDARTPGRPDTFVEWGTNVEVYATSAPDAEVVRFVSDLMGFLRSSDGSPPRVTVDACE